MLLLGPELRFPPYPAGTRTGKSQCASKRSFDFIDPLSAGRGPEKGAPPETSHANARAAIAIAVTDVVGVLVMMGSFLWLVEDVRSVREGKHSTQSNIHHRQRIK